MSFGVPPTRAAAVSKSFCQFVSCNNIIWLSLVSLKANAVPLAWPVFLHPSILLEKALAFLHHCSASRLKGFRKRARARAPAVFYHSFLESDSLCWTTGIGSCAHSAFPHLVGAGACPILGFLRTCNVTALPLASSGAYLGHRLVFQGATANIVLASLGHHP